MAALWERILGLLNHHRRNSAIDATTMDGPLFTRIRVSERDFHRLYPLILEYTDHPERATHVTEFAFRCPFPIGYRHPKTSKDGRPYEDLRDVSNETAMQKAVRHLNLPPSDEEQWVRSLSWMRPELVEERRALMQADDSPVDYNMLRWYRDCDIEFAHHAVALLLILCPNIESLIYQDDGQFVFEVLQQNNYGTPEKQYLQKLRHVHLLPSGGFPLSDERLYNDMDILKLIRMFHRLPAIESVRADGISVNGDAGYESTFPPRVSKIRSVHIGHNWLPGHLITTLIQVPKELEEFTCTSGGRDMLGGGFYIRNIVKIGKALSQQRATLQRLDLDIDEHLNSHYLHHFEEIEGEEEDADRSGDPEEQQWNDNDIQISPHLEEDNEMEEAKDYGRTIGSFRDFTRLTHLSIGVEALLGPPPRPNLPGDISGPFEAPFRLIDALPATLEYLLIRGYTKGQVEQFDSHIEEFARLRSERLPNLQEIHGIDSFIPSGESVEDPDRNTHLLWAPEPFDDDWKTVDETLAGDRA